MRRAVTEEMAATLSDVVFRRTELGDPPGPDEEGVRLAARVVGDALGWDDSPARGGGSDGAEGGGGVRILLLAPHPFYQARGTPIAVKTVLEFLSERGDTVDVLTYAEGTEVAIPNCTVHRIPRMPGLHGIRPGFSVKKVLSDVLMVGSCLRLVRRTRYDLIHAVEESAFIAAAMRALTGVPYVYDMDSSLAEQLVDAYPPLRFAFPALRRMEAAGDPPQQSGCWRCARRWRTSPWRTIPGSWSAGWKTRRC